MDKNVIINLEPETNVQFVDNVGLDIIKDGKNVCYLNTIGERILLEHLQKKYPPDGKMVVQFDDISFRLVDKKEIVNALKKERAEGKDD